MTTSTNSPATVRKAKAAAALRQLTNERQTILSRQTTAQETIERLNQDIIQAQRSGEADALTNLRADRREGEESVQDLQRALPGLDREIELVTGEMVMAERAVQAENWNKIQTEQAALLTTITEAVELIANSIIEKEKLAHVQQKVLANVCIGADRNPALIRHDLAFAITARLQGMTPTTLRTVDWTCLRMTEQGDLR